MSYSFLNRTYYQDEEGNHVALVCGSDGVWMLQHKTQMNLEYDFREVIASMEAAADGLTGVYFTQEHSCFIFIPEGYEDEYGPCEETLNGGMSTLFRSQQSANMPPEIFSCTTRGRISVAFKHSDSRERI